MSVCCECCLVEVSATGRSLVQRNRTECDVSECDREAVLMRSWPTGAIDRCREAMSDISSIRSNVTFVEQCGCCAAEWTDSTATNCGV
jgi:hypothetical protein